MTHFLATSTNLAIGGDNVHHSRNGRPRCWSATQDLCWIVCATFIQVDFKPLIVLWG